MKQAAGYIGGFFFALAGSILTIILFATSTNGACITWAFSQIVLWNLAMYFCKKAPSVRNAWSQMFGAFGFMLLVIPFALLKKIDQPFETGGLDHFYDYLNEAFLFLWPLAAVCIGGALASAIVSWKLSKELKLGTEISSPALPINPK